MVTFAAFALTLFLSLSGPSGSQAKGTGTVALEIQGERLTLRAEDTPLAVILERLAGAMGFVVHYTEPVEERVSVDLAGVSFEEGIQCLLQHRNTLLVYDKHPQGLSAVYVFGPRGSAVTGTGASLATSASAGEGEIDLEAEMLETACKIAALEQVLRDVSAVESQQRSRLLQNFMADPESSVRISALQWLAGRQDVDTDALATALRDSDYVVQSVATQIILDRGVDDQAVKEVIAAAQVEDEATVRQMLSALFAQ